MGEEKRHQMMQNLFGDQSEDEEDEIDSDNDDFHRRPRYQSGEEEGEAEFDGGGEAEVEGQGEVEVESEGEPHGIEPDEGESEGERAEKETSDQRAESEGKEGAESEEEEDYDPKTAATSTRRDVFVSGSEKSDDNNSAQNDDMVDDHGKETAESDEQEEYGQRTATSRRRDVIASDSEESDDNRYIDNEEEEVSQSRRRRLSDDEDGKHRNRNAHSTDEIRDVFGDSDEDEPEDYATQSIRKQESYRSHMEDDENDDQDLRPEDMVQEEDMRYESEEDNIDQKHKEKPVGPPLELEIPLRPPPGLPEKMNMIRVSNIMGIEPKPFDPKTYVEEDVFVTDESGTKKRIRLEDNIVRWRNARNRDGTLSYESNARFVRWSDGSLQLLIGNEVLDISVQEAQHDQTHLFLRHGKGILQSQGRLLKKMRFMPSSLSSKSHRLLTALVDSRNKKVYKVKNCITDIDPEREKEEKEKAEGQTIRANVLLHRKREKVNRKYSQTAERGRQLSPGFLEDALDEDDEPEDDYYAPHRSRRRLEEDLEEAQAEKRIMNAKRSQIAKNVRPKQSFPAARATRRPVEDSSESDREESEYESTGDEDDRYTSRKRSDEPENRYDDSEQEEVYAEDASEEDEDEEPKARSKEPKESLKRKEIESDSDSSPRKRTTHRRRAVVYESDEE